MARKPQIVLVSRELFPFASGGIGEYVWATAKLLSAIADVTVLTSDRHKAEYSELVKAGDPRLPGARIEFVAEVEPHQVGSFYSTLHRFSARVRDRIVALFPDGGPDLIEFSDYLGEGFVTIQSRRTHDPRLARSRVAVRLHTTAEMCLVLDQELPLSDLELETIFEMERYALARADVLLWPGGDVLEAYRRFYDDIELAPAQQARNPYLPVPVDAAAAGEEPPQPEPDAPLRFLYMGRMERRKGVQNLLRAFRGLHGDWRLTLLGGDTQTAPMGSSMRDQLELMAAGERRISFHAPVPRGELAALIRAHDVVVLPSLWECWPYVALEALSQNRPVLATPTGGYTGIVEEGVSGWLTADAGEHSLHRTLGRFVDDAAAIRRLSAENGPRERFELLADNDEIVRVYERICAATPAAPASNGARPPLVSVIVPYFKLDQFVERTIASIAAQSYPRIETVIVNDGSFRAEDWALAEVNSRWPVSVFHQPNTGLGAARNFAISQSRGRYVLPLDADDEIEPEFVARAVEVLEHDESLAYVGCWSRFVLEDGSPYPDPAAGYEPFGNWSRLNTAGNFAGSCTALFRARLFDRGYRYSQDLVSYEDWSLYQELAQDGHFGDVIPERMLRYRTRASSMMRALDVERTTRLRIEMKARLIERRVRWTR